jgi:putative tryptophan/tyrosine transport system substrate-binding protein
MNKKGIYAIFVVFVLVVIGAASYMVLGKNNPKKSQAPKVYEVGILNGFNYVGKNADGFKAGMTELGYIEGKNINYYVQQTKPIQEEYVTAVKNFADKKVDLMFIFPTAAALEGKKVAMETGIPLVFANSNFEGVDLIKSIKEPGNNLTGVRYPGPDVALKRLEILMEILPNTKTILMPYDKTKPIVPSQLDILYEFAPKYKVELIEMPVATPKDLEDQLKAFAKTGKKIDAIMTLVEIVSANPDYAAIWGKFADDNKIPTGGALLLKKDGFKYETLFGVDIDGFASGKRAATLADKILKGTPAGTISVESAEMFISINYKLAKEMGISLDESFLNTANEIIR